MKRIIKSGIIIILLGVILIPNVVLGMASGGHQPEPVYPKAYFLLYPNGVTEGVENLSDPENPPEILIYEGISNENGEVLLEGLQSEGQLRIVETVPHGYTAIQNTFNVNLNETTTAGFVNYKGFINPNTGRKALYIILIAAIIALVIMTIKQRTTLLSDADNNKADNKEEITTKPSKKTKKGKKTAALFIVVPVLVFLAMTNTKANTKDFIITTKDNHGNKMANVEVKVYAKPISVQQAPYVKYDANGGEFLDGKTEMIFRLPSNECFETDFYRSLSEDDSIYLDLNRNGATREGYYITGTHELIDEGVEEEKKDGGASIFRREKVEKEKEPDNVLVSGQIIRTEWTANPNAHVVTIHGNGAYRKVGAKLLTSYKIYSVDLRSNSEDKFSFYNGRNMNGFYAGYDNNPECSNVSYGIQSGEVLESDNYYVCWNQKPDGIYVNNEFYAKGNMDNCYSTSGTYLGREDTLSFNVRNYTGLDSLGTNKIKFVRLRSNNIEFLFYNETFTGGIREAAEAMKKRVDENAICSDSSCVQARVETTYYDINKVEIVSHGQVIASFTGDDLLLNTDEFGVKHYSIVNSEKLSVVNNLFNDYIDKCVGEEDPIGGDSIKR